MMIFSDLWSKWEEFNGINSEPSQIPEEKLWFVCVVLGRLLLSLWCWLRSPASSSASWTITWVGCRLVSGISLAFKYLREMWPLSLQVKQRSTFVGQSLTRWPTSLLNVESGNCCKCSMTKMCIDIPVIAAYLVFLAITVSRFVSWNEIRIIIVVRSGAGFCSLTNIVATVAAFLLLLTISSLEVTRR